MSISTDSPSPGRGVRPSFTGALAWALVAALTLTACAAPSGPPPNAPEKHAPPLALTYLGVAGWQLTDGAHTLLVDPYFTRADVADDAAPLSPNLAQITRYAPARADVILVEHSHYDHLLDVPTIARRTGATVIGTDSSLNVARADGVAETQLVVARGGETFDVGPFSVRALRGLHSLVGLPATPIPREVTMPMEARAYTEGGTLQYLVRVHGRSILFIGSANFIEGELTGLRPDVALVAVGLREKIPDYTCRLMRALGRPRLVLTNHFDAHHEPLGPKQMSLGDDARTSLAKFADEVHSCAPDTKVVVPTHLQPLAL
ncbi:secreted protein [Minicystis rosea]|nr:secreted protein [Minicystis rosea]